MSKRHETPDGQIIRWVKAYQAFGEEGLRRSRVQQTYTFKLKRSAVECYLSAEASYQEVAIMFGLNNPSLLPHWTKEYRSGCVDALNPTSKERAPTMPRKKNEHTQDFAQGELWVSLALRSDT